MLFFVGDADCSVGLIFLPTGAGKVSARNTSIGRGIGFSHHRGRPIIQEMGQTGDGIQWRLKTCWEDIFRNRTQKSESGQDGSLCRVVGVGMNDVEAERRSVAHDKQAVAKIMAIAHLAARQRRVPGKFVLE